MPQNNGRPSWLHTITHLRYFFYSMDVNIICVKCVSLRFRCFKSPFKRHIVFLINLCPASDRRITFVYVLTYDRYKFSAPFHHTTVIKIKMFSFNLSSLQTLKCHITAHRYSKVHHHRHHKRRTHDEWTLPHAEIRKITAKNRRRYM